MSVTEFERHQLYSWLEEHMGQERATAMISMLPPTGWGDVVTRWDLQMLEARLDSKIDTLEARLDSKLDTLEARLDSKLEARLGEFRSDLMRTLGTWLFASQAAVIAVVSLVVTLVVTLT